jgi:hypothetical protein
MFKRFVLGILLITSVAACAPKFADSPFCRQAAVNQYEKSGGPSTPIELKLSDNQSVEIEYVAQWDKGKVAFEIWDDAGIPVWTAPLQKTSTALKVTSKPLPAGTYRLLNVADDATNGAICMTGKVQ